METSMSDIKEMLMQIIQKIGGSQDISDAQEGRKQSPEKEMEDCDEGCDSSNIDFQPSDSKFTKDHKVKLAAAALKAKLGK